MGIAKKERSNTMTDISLAAARVNAELTQAEVAKMIGVTTKTIRSYEKGHTVPPSPTLKKLSKIYKIPMDNIRIPIVDDGEWDE